MTDAGENQDPRGLTLWQPWASLIPLGVKRFETRSWSTKYRGPLAIHAAVRPPRAADFGDTIPARAGWIGRYNLGSWTEQVVHADPCDCDHDEENVGDRCMALSHPSYALLADEGAHGFSLATTLPLGAVVATCNLVDVLPIVDGDADTDWADLPYPRIESSMERDHPDGWLALYHPDSGTQDPEDGMAIPEQAPYGDYAPGRFAWMLDDVRAIEPVPMKGGQGLWTRPELLPLFGSNAEPA